MGAGWLGKWPGSVGWSCQPHPQPPWGRGEGLEVELVTNGQWFNRSWSCLCKNLKGWGSESFQVGEHMELLGGWCTWAGHGRSRHPPPPNLLCASLLYGCCILYSRLINISKVPSWVLWAILESCWTYGGSHGKPWFVAIWSEVWEAWGLVLASPVGATSWDWALNLWDLMLSPGR